MATIAASAPIPAAGEAADTPLPSTNRIEALDFVRGVALFGILLMNIVGAGLGPAYDNPTVAGGAEGINLWTWIVINVGFEGTQRALFSMLFGAGIILFTSRMETKGRPDSADLYFRRNLWLVGFGLVNAWILLWIGDILFYYGITALFLYTFRKLAGPTLLALGLGALLLGAAWNALDAHRSLGIHEEARTASAVPEAKRTDEQKGAIEAWKEKEEDFAPPPPAVEGIRQGITASYWSAMQSYGPLIKHFQSWQLYRGFFDIFGMMLIGMAFFKMGVLTLGRRRRVYLGMMVGGYVVGLVVGISEVRWIIRHDFSLLAYQQASITYDVSRLTMTLGHLGALMLFLSTGLFAWLRHALACVGRMAFSNYIAHSVIALVTFVLLGYWGAFERHQLYLFVFAIWAVQLVVSPIWLRHYRFGPLEWLWRYLTYGKRPPFRRSEPAPSVAAPGSGGIRA